MVKIWVKNSAYQREIMFFCKMEFVHMIKILRNWNEDKQMEVSYKQSS